MHLRRVRFVAVVPALLSAGILAACGSSSTSSGGGGVSSHSSSAGTGAASGGSPAASGSPIRIGFANINSGAISFPGEEQGAKVAVQVINKELGGINGHSVQLVYCDMQLTTQAAQACGQQFAGDSSMAFAMYTIDPSTGPAYFAPLNAAHKPILGGLPSTSSDDTAKNAFFIYPGSVGFYGFLSSFAKSMPQKGLKNFSYLFESEQSAEEGLNEVKAAIKGTDVQLSAASMNPSAADFISNVQAAKMTSADVVFLGGSSECPGIAKDMKTLGIKPKLVITNSQCLPTSALAQDPSLYEGWIVIAQSQSPSLGKGKVDDVTNFLNNWNKYGPGGAASNIPPLAEEGYGEVMTARDMLKTADVSSLTPAAAEAAIKNYKGHVTMGGDFSCPGPANGPAECASKSEVFYKVVNGAYTPITQDQVGAP